MQDTVATQRCPKNETPSWFRTLHSKIKVVKDLMRKIFEGNKCN
jgi:hypothetical protein